MNVRPSVTYRDVWLNSLKHKHPNIDEKYPFNKRRHTKVNPEISLGEAYKNLERRRREYTKDIKGLSRKVKATDYRVKNPYSVIGKQLGRNLSTVRDMGGLRILEANRQKVYAKLKQIKRMFPKKSLTIEDKYKQAVRSRWKNPYVGIHVDLVYRKKPYEIQIKTKAQQKLHDKIHSQYKRGGSYNLNKFKKQAISLYKKGK